jgi:hypothetical protein
MKAGPGVKLRVSLLTLTVTSPGERWRVKRLSKFTDVNIGWLMALDRAA